jgi:nitroreductase
VDVVEAIRTRRTHKAFGAEPVPRETVEELLSLARFAPNHLLTQPWRFRVLGPETLARLAAAGNPGELAKLQRAPTLVVVSAKLSAEPWLAAEDLHATAAAAYIVLLAAHARGLASYWRTPKVLQSRHGQEAIGMAEDEEFVGLIHLGPRTAEPEQPEREPLESVVEFLP